MRVGVPKEIKDRENRVALTPEGVRRLTSSGHQVLIQAGAGLGVNYSDADYQQAGAELVSVDAAWDCDLVVKVKEPLEAEYGYLKDQILFTFLHLAGVDPGLTTRLVQQKTTAIGYETVENQAGRLPLLAPMSAIAGNCAVAMGNYHLAAFNGGRGVLLGEIFDQPFGKVLVVGDGVVGRHAAKAAAGMGSQVTIAGLDEKLLPELKKSISCDLRFVLSTPENIARELVGADLVVGGVLLPGAKAPYVITREMVQGMQKGAVIADVSIDQGGCVETSRPTTHSDPVFVAYDVIHYCVTNMPAAYPRTATIALTKATLPYVEKLASQGLQALREDEHFAKGLNTCQGFITCEAVAESLSMTACYKPLETLL